MGDLSGAFGRDGAVTLSGPLSQQRFAPDARKITYQGYNARGQKAGAFQIELIPLHSPLLRESWLVSFPPLSNMFKFSGSSCLSSALVCLECSTSADVLRSDTSSTMRSYLSHLTII